MKSVLAGSRGGIMAAGAHWKVDAAIGTKIHDASKGPRGAMNKLLGRIQKYINTEMYSPQATKEGRAGEVGKVPCPTAKRWGELSNGKRPVLPSEARLRMYANDAMRNLAANPKVGSLHKAYFLTAKYHLMHGRTFDAG